MKKTDGHQHNFQSISGLLFLFFMAVVFFWLAFQQRIPPAYPILRPLFVLLGFSFLFGVYLGMRNPIQNEDRRIHIYHQVTPISCNLEINSTLVNESECIGRVRVQTDIDGERSFMVHLWCAEGVTQDDLGVFPNADVFIDPKTRLPIAVDGVDRTFWVEEVLEAENLAS